MVERIKVEVNQDYGWIEDLPTYRQIVDTFGEVLVEEEDGEYQGDSLYLIKRDYKFGVLTFGWGSCSGCDALQGCETQRDIDDLQDDLEWGIKWFDNLDEVKHYLLDGGLKGSYLNSDLVLNFGAQIVKIDEY